MRTVNLMLSNPGPNPGSPHPPTTKLGTRSSAVLKIIDNNLSLAFSAPNYTVRENLTLATITVELTGVNTTPVIVNWASSNGTATAGSDYGIRNSLYAAVRGVDLRGGWDTDHGEDADLHHPHPERHGRRGPPDGEPDAERSHRRRWTGDGP